MDKDMRALIAMSGGVDSSVAAYLALEAGYRCMGATMRLWGEGDAEDAGAVAARLGIPFRVVDLSGVFRARVIDKFVRSYEAGETPNPCVDCNRYLKFGALLEEAEALGCGRVVTGHYARIQREGGRYLLKKALDPARDQSYVLYTLTQGQLERTWFPLGTLKKDQVREIAAAQGFANAQRRDSQDICFIPDGDYAAFLERYAGRPFPEGDFLDLEGRVVGRHRGAVRYTTGQRKGLALAMGSPVYVCRKDMSRNTVTVGPESTLYAPALLAGDWNWIAAEGLSAPLRVTARTRYRQAEQGAVVRPAEDGRAVVEFDHPQRAVTAGQAVVLYDGDTVVGGGTILKPLP